MCAMKFSLSFTKTIEKKNLQPSAIRNDVPEAAKDKTEVLESIEENVLKTDAKSEEQELVIPLVTADRMSILRKIAEKKLEIESKKKNEKEASTDEVEKNEEVSEKSQKVLTLDEQAEAAILEESRRKLEDWSERAAPSNLAIYHEDDEDDNKLGSTSAGKESSLDDYEEVDVSVFGAALLRGMGWQKTEGIGKITKKVVEVIDPTSKTFGLSSTKKDPDNVTKEKSVGDNEELQLAKGSFVFIHSGRQRGTYGVVESLDEDHLLVKVAVRQDVIREVELNVRVVSQKEYKDSSRVINKDMYDKYKEEEAKKKAKKNKNISSDESDENDSKGRIKEGRSQNSQIREKIKVDKVSETAAQPKKKSEEIGSRSRSELSENVKTEFAVKKEKSDYSHKSLERDRYTENEDLQDETQVDIKGNEHKRKEQYKYEDKIKYKEKSSTRKEERSPSCYDKYGGELRHSDKLDSYEGKSKYRETEDDTYRRANEKSEKYNREKFDEYDKYKGMSDKNSDRYYSEKSDRYSEKSDRYSEKSNRYSEKSNKNREETDRYPERPDKYIEKSDRYSSKPERYSEKYKNLSESKSEKYGEKYSSVGESKSEKYSEKYSSVGESKSEKYGEKYSSVGERKSDKYREKYKSSSDKSQKRSSESIYSAEYKKAKKAQELLPVMPWITENLRVRLINKDYKGGRYHKEKVIVKFVETAESCECITTEGKVLREVNPAWLETVIPKVEPQIVSIVKGQQKGQRGRILELHKDQEKASIQLLEDKTVILKLHYDDICEYVKQY